MISVIVTFHNQERFVDRCLRGFATQDVNDDFEIICVNDSSTDGTPDKLSEWAEKYDNIQIVDVRNRSVTKSRNDGLDFAKGDYICFFDGDDYVRPGYLYKLKKAIDDNEVHFSYARFTMTKSAKPFERCNFLEFEPSFLEYGNLINTPTMIKRECLEDVKWDENITVMEDWELSINLVRHGYRGVAVPEYLWHYQLHSESSWNGKKLKVDHEEVRRYIKEKHGIHVKRLSFSIGVVFDGFEDDEKLAAIENVNNKWDCHLFVIVNGKDERLLRAIKDRLPFGFGSYRILFMNMDYADHARLYHTMELFFKIPSISGSDEYLLIK